MGEYNPYHPTVLGMEFPPIVKAPVLLDTATEVGYRFTPATNLQAVNLVRLLTTQPPPGQPLRKCLAVNLYRHGEAPSSGVVRTLTIPCNSGSLGSGAANVGAANVQDCVRNPSDTAWTSLTGAAASVRMWFDVNASRVTRALQNARILDVSVRYAVTGPFDTLPDGLVLALERPSATSVFDMDNALIGPVNQYDNVVPRLSRLGDLNPFWNTTLVPSSNYERAPWHYAAGASNHSGLTALAATGGTNINVQFHTSAAAAGLEFRIQYAALQITYGSEDRTAAGGLEITPGATIVNDQFVYDVPTGAMTSWGFSGFALQGYFYDLCVGQGYCGNLSVAYPVPLSVDRLSKGEIYGPHEGIIIRKTLRPGEVWTSEPDDAFPAMAIYSSESSPSSVTIFPGSQTYTDQLVVTSDQLTFADETQALIVDDNAGTYPFVRFYARVQQATVAEMTVKQVDISGNPLGPEATITVAELLALPEIAAGWRKVTLTWSTPIVTTGSGLIRLHFDTLADTGAPWEFLGADANPYDTNIQDIAVPTYGSSTAYALIDDIEDFTADVTAMLVQAMPVPAGVTIGTAVQPLQAVDEYCAEQVGGIPTGITYLTVEWTPVNADAVAGFAWYEVQRRDTTMESGVWETVATVTDVSQGAFSDYEARIGVATSYRVRFVHVDGYTSDWSSTVSTTIAAPGVTGSLVGKSVLVMTTNHDPASNIAQAMVWDTSGGVPVQDFTFLEGSQTALQAMYQRDYRVAFRPLERGGVEFTRTLLINALGVPPQTLSDGFTGLRDLAWDTVPYVCVRDEMANRWLTSVSVPAGTVRDVPDAGHLMLAQAVFSEVTATPAPIDYAADCQGLILGARDNLDSWTTPTGVNDLNGTLAVTDTFTRSVAGGWGAANTGQTYTLSSAADSSVNGTQGVLTAVSAAAGLSARMSGVREFYRAETDVIVPAVATGGIYRAAQLFHCQDQVVFTDTFVRNVAAGWGTADSGQTYVVGDTARMLVTGGRGRILLDTTVRQFAYADYGRPLAEWTIGRIGLPAALTGATGTVTTTFDFARSADFLSRVSLNIVQTTGSNTTYNVTTVRGGSAVDTSATVNSGLASNLHMSVRIRMNGPQVQVRLWQQGTAEPGTWNIDEEMVDPSVNTNIGVTSTKSPAVTNVGLYIEFDDINAVLTDGFDHLRTELVFNTDATIDMQIVSRVSNTDYVWETVDVAGTYTVGSVIHMVTNAMGFCLESIAWIQGQTRPSNFDSVGYTKSSDLAVMPEQGGGLYGLLNARNSGNSNANLAIAFDNLNLYQYPTVYDVRVLARPIADEWSWQVLAQAYYSQYSGGEWWGDASNADVRWYLNGPEFGQVDVTNTSLFAFFKNQLAWLRYYYELDDGTGLSRLTIYTSLDGSSWTSRIVTRPAGNLGPVAPAPIPADGLIYVTVNGPPAQGVWVQKVEIRIDGVLLYDPDFRDHPPGTTSFTDTEGNLWSGGAALCVES